MAFVKNEVALRAALVTRSAVDTNHISTSLH